MAIQFPVNVYYNGIDPAISIIVLNFNRASLTRKCLKHLWKHTTGGHFEILVVDNGSSVEDLRHLAEAPGPFTLLQLGSNRYFSEGNNIGAEHSRGRHIVFLNNDAFVTKGWLEPLITVLEHRPNAGGVGPRFIYPDGRLQEAGAFVDEDGYSIQVGNSDIHDVADQFRERIVDYCSAACLAVTREAFELVGGFDPVYEPAYYEDADLCFKIGSLGKHIFYCPYSTVVHIKNATSFETWDRLAIQNIIERNRRIFLSRWGGWLRKRARTIGRAPELPNGSFGD
jgi:GT2 family glycosyltransferase